MDIYEDERKKMKFTNEQMEFIHSAMFLKHDKEFHNALAQAAIEHKIANLDEEESLTGDKLCDECISDSMYELFRIIRDIKFKLVRTSDNAITSIEWTL